MSDAQPPPHNGNGRRGGGVLVSVSEKLIRVLPPAFIALLVLNIVFIAVIAWVFDHNAETRNALLTKIVERCLLNPAAPPR
jgi:hypothetical protein